MKHDPEYNSYKFSTMDLNVILDSLDFYHTNNTELSQESRDYIYGLTQSLENSMHEPIV